MKKSIQDLIKEELDQIAPLLKEFGDEAPAPAPVDTPAIDQGTENSLTGANNIKAAKQIKIVGDEGQFSGKIVKVQEMPTGIEITFMTPWKDVEKIALGFHDVEELLTSKTVRTPQGQVTIV